SKARDGEDPRARAARSRSERARGSSGPRSDRRASGAAEDSARWCARGAARRNLREISGRDSRRSRIKRVECALPLLQDVAPLQLERRGEHVVLLREILFHERKLVDPLVAFEARRVLVELLADFGSDALVREELLGLLCRHAVPLRPRG